ncbi:ABC transporter permease [Konateibacter massiliensis]|uniref:ABC transporter permease n=1 Tax=Konateibacter massiliensis TaxID=2002841 RepID=UPI000C14A58D|nr:ABC transporter permease [Konateibacter massiliensis]
MFIQLVKYRLLKLFRTKDELFWCLAFPLILGTLFYISFGNITQKDEAFQTIDIAYITAEGADEEFGKIINELEKEGDTPLIHIMTEEEEEAKELLFQKEIAGIIYNGKEITLTVNGEGLNESILSSFLNKYGQTKETITNIAMTSPDKLERAIELVTADVSVVKETSFTDHVSDPMMSYFYALIAMSCLYGCFSGMSTAIDLKANLSALGARRISSPENKMKMILGDFTALIIGQFLCTLVTVFYLIYVLKVDIGYNMPYLILTVLVGGIIGIATGTFIGSVGKGSMGGKMAVMLSVTMTECFLSGLMMGNMKDIVEQNAPIINRINPAALIVDALYSLDIYNTYDRYRQNIISMLVIAAILCVGSFLAIRRERYASI